MGCMKSKQAFPFPTTIDRSEPPERRPPPERPEPPERPGPRAPSPLAQEVEELQVQEVEEVQELQVQELQEVEEVQAVQPVQPVQEARERQERPEAKDPAAPKVAVKAFAHRLSEEILSGALQQWVDSNAKYADIPFIEGEGPGAAQR